jgi:hypothetical protein
MSTRPASLAVGTLAIVLSLTVARVLWGAASEHEAARKAEAGGQTAEAIVHHRRALGWYVPLSPYTARSLAALERIASEARTRGDQATARLAERAIQGGLHSARSTFQPEASALSASESRLAPDAERAPDPSVAMSLIAVLAWLGFVASAVALILGRGTPWRASVAMSLAFVAFCLGLWLA